MRTRKQTGYIYPRSGWWWLRWREDIIENGQSKRKHLAKKITPILPQHHRLKRPPPEVEQQADEMLHSVNSGSVSVQGTQDLVDFTEQLYLPGLAQQHHASTIRGTVTAGEHT